MENFMGVPPANPPPNVEAFPETPEGVMVAQTVRERLAGHRDNPACAGCDDVMDPIGLSLENFDAVGEYRTMDGPYPIDTTGLSYQGHTISDVASLAALVKSDPRFVPCVSHQLYAYAMGQQAEDGDAATVSALDAAAASSGESLRAMTHLVVHSPAFLTKSSQP